MTRIILAVLLLLAIGCPAYAHCDQPVYKQQTPWYNRNRVQVPYQPYPQQPYYYQAQPQAYPPIDTTDQNYGNQLIWWRGYHLVHMYYQPVRLANGQTFNVLHYVLMR